MTRKKSFREPGTKELIWRRLSDIAFPPRLAVRYHFEATTLTENPTYLDTRVLAPPLSLSFNPRDRRNPYLLTWALRGIIEDQQIRELFSEELHALREAYEVRRADVLERCTM